MVEINNGFVLMVAGCAGAGQACYQVGGGGGCDLIIMHLMSGTRQLHSAQAQ